MAEDEGTDVSAQPERDRGPRVGAGDDRGPWDLLVVGGGTAGLVAARTARSLGARVLLVERERMGGDCLWTGCVPSKSLLAAAHAAAAARGGARLGVHAGDVVVDFAQVMAHVHGAQREIAPVDSAAALERAGVRVRSGQVRLTGPGTATVDGRPVTFRSALLATGSAPVVPPLPGLADVHPLTSDSVWELDALPVRLAVLGGGSIGCELGQAFARLGAGVTLVEAEDLLLGEEDPRAAALLRRALEDDGVQVRTGSAVRQVTPGQEPGSGTLHLADGGEVEFDRLLVSVGRAPRTDGLGLEAAGVDVDDRGHVVVDEHLRTSNPRVWAAGDVTGRPPFTHTAAVHGSTAGSNAVLGLRRTAAGDQPQVTYTDPEVASVGVPVADAAGRADLRVITWEHGQVDRAVVERRTEGFTSLVLDGRHRVVGGLVVGPRAGETIAELTLAVQRGLRARDLAGVTHAYPTWSGGLWDASVEDVRQGLEAPVVRWALVRAVQARRWWLAARSRR